MKNSADGNRGGECCSCDGGDDDEYNYKAYDKNNKNDKSLKLSLYHHNLYWHKERILKETSIVQSTLRTLHFWSTKVKEHKKKKKKRKRLITHLM